MNEKKKKVLVPRLRFPEFRDAGEWEANAVGDVFDVTRGYVLSMDLVKEEWSEETPYPVYSSQTKKNGLAGFYSDFLYENAITWTTDGANAGDVNYRSGKFYCTNVCGVLNNDFGYANPCIAALINSVSKKYVSYVGNPKLMNGVMSEIVLPFPTVNEQQKIADCLSSIDDLISAQSQKVEALKIHKKGLMQQLFPREGETIPRLRFPEFRYAVDWCNFPLSNFIQSLDAGVSVNSGDRAAKSYELGILKTSAVSNGIFNSLENKVVFDESELQRLKEHVCEDTIIISRMNTPLLVGANAYVDASLKNIYLPDRLWAAKPRPGVSMRFIASILSSERGRIALSELATGTSGSMKNIAKPRVLALKISAPTFPEQQKIAGCLSSIDELISALSKKLEALKAHKKGLMQQLFPTTNEVEA